jgi:hypothetical protein
MKKYSVAVSFEYRGWSSAWYDSKAKKWIDSQYHEWHKEPSYHEVPVDADSEEDAIASVIQYIKDDDCIRNIKTSIREFNEEEILQR